MAVLEAFPRRPLRIQALNHWLLILFSLAFAAGLGAFVILEVLPSVIDDLQATERWPEATQARVVHDHCTVSRGVLHDCTLDFEYRIQSGAVTQTKIDFVTFFRSLDWNQPLIIHYDPQRPTHIITSWSTPRLTNRILTLALFFLPLVGGCTAYAISAIRQQLRIGRKMARIGTSPVPVAAKIKGVANGHWRFSFVGAGQQWRDDSTEFKKKGSPFWLDLAKTHALALADASGTQAVLLDDRLKRVNLSQQERAMLIAMRNAGPPPPQRGNDAEAQIRLTPQEAAQGKAVAVTVPTAGGPRQLTVQVPAGVVNGGRLRFASLGQPGQNGGPPGDVVISLQVG